MKLVCRRRVAAPKNTRLRRSARCFIDRNRKDCFLTQIRIPIVYKNKYIYLTRRHLQQRQNHNTNAVTQEYIRDDRGPPSVASSSSSSSTPRALSSPPHSQTLFARKSKFQCKQAEASAGPGRRLLQPANSIRF